MALSRVRILSPNYSSRQGAKVRLIVLHTAEGSKTFQSLGSYFSNPASQVSSHVGIDDTFNTVGEYVDRPNKAWTAANANPVAVQAELCAFAGWSTAEWNNHKTMLENCAKWIGEEAAAFKIPLVRLSAQSAQSNGVGICRHMDLGTWGGNHSDPGNNFPIDQVIQMAGGNVAPIPPPQPGPQAPPFPYPSDNYLGQPSADPRCHSGFYGGVDTQNVRTWQARMLDRGWRIDPDGKYGPQSESVCRAFQSEKGLVSDGLVGPKTWAASWNAPVT